MQSEPSYRLSQNPNEQEKPYTGTIFGNDYYEDGCNVQNGLVKNKDATVLFEEQINNKTALTKHTVDNSKYRVIYVEIVNLKDLTLKNEGDVDTYILIIEGMKVSK